MNLVLYYLIIGTIAHFAVCQGVVEFINDYYGSCASSCASQAYDWQEESGIPTQSRLSLCSVSHTAFLEKLICCISQSDGCSSDVQVDVINQDIKEWCSWETYIKTPRQTSFRDSPQLPSACSSSVWCTSSPDSEVARRSYYPSASDFNSGSSSNSSFSGKKVAGIVIVCMVVALGLAMGIITCGVRASRANSRPARVNPRPPPLPMHTARHSSTVQPRNSPQRPPTAIIRGGTPPPPPYSAKDEPTPHYESIRMAS